MAMSTRKKVEIPDKAWLDTFKFLMGSQWLNMRFVSHHLADVIRGNISELPRVIIDNVKFWETFMHSKSAEITAYDNMISPNEKREWFMKRGINLDVSTSLQHKDAVIGMGAKYGNLQRPTIYYYAEVSELVEAAKIIPSKRKTVWRKVWDSGEGYQKGPKPVLFSAAFNPDRNKYSWACLEYFLNLIYNPLTYIKEVEMYALNKNSTDAFFLGDDYGSYIHCKTFILVGDICKSLPWIQKNVRADTIYLPGDFTDIDNSYKEASNFLLNKPWICTNQTQSMKTVKIELESVHDWKSFIKILINKFRTRTTMEHTTLTIDFSFREAKHEEKSNLNYLVWNTDVVKFKPEDSQGAEAVYLVSNGRNRMEIAIFKSDVVSVNTYTIQPAAPVYEKMYILDDTWLEALKFLSFPQWSKSIFVSRQLARVVQGNTSRLPCIVFDSATMSKSRRMSSDIVSFDDIILSNKEKQFFTELGNSSNAPADVQHANAIVGLSSKYWCSKYPFMKLYLRDTAQDNLPSQKPVIFSAQFGKQNEYSWAALKYFLEFLYHPAVYIKEVEIFALNQKIIGDLFDDGERFIRCDAFTLRGETESSNMDEFRKSLSWMEQNVRANIIYIPEHIDYNNETVYEPIANFLMDASWKCARQEVYFKFICDADSFVAALMEKFRSVSFIRKDIPMVMPLYMATMKQ